MSEENRPVSNASSTAHPATIQVAQVDPVEFFSRRDPANGNIDVFAKLPPGIGWAEIKVATIYYQYPLIDNATGSVLASWILKWLNGTPTD